MEYLTKSVTDALVKKIPSGKSHFTTADLRAAGLPGFIIRLIELEIGDILNEAILAGGSEWIDTENPDVAEARRQFFKSVHAHLRLPAAHTPGIIEAAVETTLDILVRPRVVIPEVVFGDDTVLVAGELEKRSGRVTVFRHLATAPLKYVARKNLRELSIEQCRNIIKKVDEKLIASYNALDWVRLADPLYQLAGEKVDPLLLKLFFEDKGMTAVAREFEKADQPVTRLRMIEMLSAAGNSDLSGLEEAQSTLSGMYGVDVSEDDSGPSVKPLVEPDGGAVDDSEEPAGEKESDEEATPIWQRFAPGYTEEAEEEPISWFGAGNEEAGDESGEEPRTYVPQSESQQENSRPDFNYGGGKANISEMDENPSQDLHSFWEELENQTGSPDEPDEEPESQTISPDEPDDEPADREKRYVPLAILEAEERGDTKDALVKLLESDRSRYVKKLFRGSETEFINAVSNLAAFSTWKEATRYIEDEIFSKNRVDIFTDEAIGFTDLLHAFFINRTSE